MAGCRASFEDHRLFEQAFFGEVGWPELLKHQRVIVLAEAGSGKSIELEEQAHALTTAGEYAFHATVKNVASYGLATAIGRPAVARLTEMATGQPDCLVPDR